MPLSNYNADEIIEQVENSTLEEKKAWSFVLLVVMNHLRYERDNQTRKREKVRVSIAITKINQAFEEYKKLTNKNA